ncbi:microtubule binding protein (plasmid) [Advenella kashmirensis WT001]|uniref:Microtubule binding protein n=1 Tax=Advenella kashmirensis (strain DSM 17095 / LMG 22695 / WT001) TaxID=1036672 RepID=I3UI21_ADVKW|nr:SH3 domain-containing protein [Advenella kashmirensis]AFK64659.1 microtubule binding protein [Advenella kashmirensis WT001]
MSKKTINSFDDQLIAAWEKSSFALREMKNVNAITAQLTSQTDFTTHIKEILSSKLPMAANVDRLMQSHPDLYSKLQEFGDPEHKFAKYYFDLLVTTGLRQSKSLKSFYDALPTYKHVDFIDSVHVDNNGDVSIGSDTVSLTSFDKELETLPSAESESNQEAYQKFITWFNTLSKGAQFVLLLVIQYWMSVIANVTTPLHKDWVSKFIGIDNRVAKKEILNEVREFYRPLEVENYRFVSASTLNVRASNSDRSEVIDILNFGKSIIFIEKNKSWSLIKYVDPDGNIKQGWVFSRYLHKLVK